jgi:hypothetical protein
MREDHRMCAISTLKLLGALCEAAQKLDLELELLESTEPGCSCSCSSGYVEHTLLSAEGGSRQLRGGAFAPVRILANFPTLETFWSWPDRQRQSRAREAPC